MPDGASRSSGAFRLTPNEDFLFGVRQRDEGLRFGPAGGKLLWAGLSSLLTIAIGLLSFLASYDSVKVVFWKASPAVGHIAAIPVFVGVVAYFVETARSGVRADSDGVTVRTALRSQHYPWSQITGTRIVETEPDPNFSVTLGEGGTGLRPDVQSAKAYLVLVDDSLVRLTGFESSAKAWGKSDSMASPTEIKVGALDRYRRSVAPGNPAIRRIERDLR